MSLNLSVEEQPPAGIYIFAAIALGFIGFFGFFLNLLVIITIVKNANVLWTPNNVVLINMVIGDFLVAALGNPFTITSAIAGEWFWSHEVCLWYAWFMTTMGFASIGNLTVMAMERFLLVTCPMKTLSIRHAYILAILVWMYALSLSLPPFFNWGIYGPEAGNISCSVSWEIHDPDTHNDTYIGFLFIVGFFLPVMIIVSSYCGIIKTLRKIGKRVGARNRREKKVTKMVYLMIFAFLIAWLPYAVLALATQYFYVQASYILAVLPALLAKSSICYNPIIYASMTAQFPTWKKMFSINNAKSKQQHGSELQTK
ncbi:Green-sensitive opsin [Trachymyrmex septentrionalis]|uniref:Green-sensitive opsin n=1 Tax=Trachymyrmex septentrionalis TaxID=34720 RepID=A0A195ET22_9HYME|nr:PREDICTED: green-sensitive opsin-like [Trachymyrmex septentrionalis]KYN31400.1 Green-sensitive opsin [Trachymyrmex septentrionalis]